MKRTQLALLVVSFAALLNLPDVAEARGSSIAKSLGNLRWGMSEMELRTALKGKLKDKSQLRALESSRVLFDGSRTRWDNSPVAEEYTHGNDESMLTYTGDDGSENYYFFISDELWKWVKLYPASTFGPNYKGFSSKVRGRFGKGYEKTGEVNPGTGFRYKFLEFLDRNTRLRAVDKTEGHGKYALVFEAMETVRSISALRSSTIRRVTNKAAVAKADKRASAEESPRAAKSNSGSRQTFTLSSSKKRSIFADEQQQGESASAYEARKQRTIEQQRAKQRREHERKEDAKKGKTLDELAGVDDDDPLAGMK